MGQSHWSKQLEAVLFAVAGCTYLKLSDDNVVSRIVAQCATWGCTGVFCCSDDAALKRRLATRFSVCPATGTNYGILFSDFAATLSSTAGQAAHFDETLDRHKKAEDVMIEVFLMAHYC